MDPQILQEINFWHWWIAALGFAVLELLLPGVLFLWLALAAGVVGFVLLGLPGLTWENQVIIFSVLGVVSAVAGRVIYKRDSGVSDHPTLNKRAEQHMGRALPLEGEMKGGRGRVRIGDSVWGVEGPEGLSAGTKVKVIGASGSNLVVEKVETE